MLKWLYCWNACETFVRLLKCEISLINCEIDLIPVWPLNCVITNWKGIVTVAITNGRLFVAVVTLWTQDNTKLLQQLNSGFKNTINWNKFLWNQLNKVQNRYLDHLVHQSLQAANRLFKFFLKMKQAEKGMQDITFQRFK